MRFDAQTDKVATNELPRTPGEPTGLVISRQAPASLRSHRGSWLGRLASTRVWGRRCSEGTIQIIVSPDDLDGVQEQLESGIDTAQALAALRAEGPYADQGLEHERQRMIDLCQRSLGTSELERVE